MRIRSRWSCISMAVLALAGCGGSNNADLAADNGFRPGKDGFGFQNYGNQNNPTNLTAAELQTIFGDVVCGATAAPGQACPLTPAAHQWAVRQNDGMNGGHCFGMSHLANLIFMDKIPVSTFNGTTTNELKLEGNEQLQRSIAGAFVQQFVSPSRAGAKPELDPMALVELLSKALKSKDETYTVGFYKSDGTGGHAVTPYAIRPSADKIQLMVWDNNFPNEERSIDIDPKANTWTYVAAADPTQEASSYTGDAKTKSIGVYPVSPALGQQTCAFCGNTGAQGDVQVMGNGPARLRISDGMGHTIDDRTSDFPGASKKVVLFGGPAITSPEPEFDLPGGVDLTVTLDGSELTSASGEDVRAFGPGWVLGVAGVSLSPGQKDTVQVSKNGDTLTYTTTAKETPDVIFGVQTEGPDYEIDLKVSGEASGVTVELHIDLQSGKLSLRIKAAGDTSYAIDMRRVDKAGEQVFKHAGNSVGGNDTVYLDFGTWQGDGQPMGIETDHGSKGMVDDTQMVSDEP